MKQTGILMTPEGLLNDNGFCELLHGVRDEHGEPGIQKQVWDFVLQAMKEYAAQEAVGFAEWKEKNGWVYFVDGTWRKWDGIGYGATYTAAEAYAIYKKGGEGIDAG